MPLRGGGDGSGYGSGGSTVDQDDGVGGGGWATQASTVKTTAKTVAATRAIASNYFIAPGQFARICSGADLGLPTTDVTSSRRGSGGSAGNLVRNLSNMDQYSSSSPDPSHSPGSPSSPSSPYGEVCGEGGDSERCGEGARRRLGSAHFLPSFVRNRLEGHGGNDDCRLSFDSNADDDHANLDESLTF